MTLSVFSPGAAKLKVFNVEDPPRNYDIKNTGFRMVGFTVDVPASTESAFTVVLKLGGKRSINKRIAPLTQW